MTGQNTVLTGQMTGNRYITGLHRSINVLNRSLPVKTGQSLFLTNLGIVRLIMTVLTRHSTILTPILVIAK